MGFSSRTGGQHRGWPYSSGTGSRGFTLFEAMVAISIMAIMGTLIWGSFGPSFALKDAVEKQGERDEQVRGAVLRMAHEISMAFLSNDYDKGRYREMLTLFDGRHGAGGHDTLTFTSLAHERLYENALESDQSIIGYRVLEDKTISGQYNLMRREKTVIDDQWDRGGDEEVLCEDVQGLILRYWDDAKKDWVEDWNTKDVDRTGVLPFRVEITLLIGPVGTTPQRFTTETQIFLTTPMDRTQ
jgi:general secretion pathway protein J